MGQPQLPLVEELPDAPPPQVAFERFARLPHCLFLDSVLRDRRLGRYSFLAADPFAFEKWGRSTTSLAELESRLAAFSAQRIAGLPPFQGGIGGLFGYDLNQVLERIPATRFDEFHVPWLAMGFYDVVLAYDHQQGRCWLISQGFPETEPRTRAARAAERLQQFMGLILSEGSAGGIQEKRYGALRGDVSAADLAPQYEVPGFAALTSNFSQAGFLDAVGRAVEYIHAGDVFQVNLAQRLLFPARGPATELYLRLRDRNPATFSAYFDLGEYQIVSASPERFVSVNDRQVETRPIKGTRPRTARPEADLFAGQDLSQSEKDRAENLMIVDLMRNDLSRVCRADSVRVTQLCKLEVYQFVQHLVSAVRGTLDDGRTVFDLIRAAFPGGSITGAPKVRAMEIIAELEPTARGPYCGSLGYIGFDGSLDLSILIRTITAGRGWWQLPVGGGIVAQSNPKDEYEETWHKATGLVRALLP